jgi:hypothetical protein
MTSPKNSSKATNGSNSYVLGLLALLVVAFITFNVYSANNVNTGSLQAGAIKSQTVHAQASPNDYSVQFVTEVMVYSLPDHLSPPPSLLALSLIFFPSFLLLHNNNMIILNQHA